MNTGGSPRLAAVLIILGYGAGCLAVVAWTGFHVGHNDFWGNVALAEQIRLPELSLLYNLFYPFGYPLLLRPILSAPIVPAHLLNIALGMILLEIVWRVSSRLAGPAWALRACILVGVWPKVFQYVTTPGPDIAVTVLSAAGFVQLFRAGEEDGTRGQAVTGALLLGVAALLRYHALLLGIVTIAATAIASASWRRHVIVGLAAFFAIYSLQMIVAVSAGYGPFHTGQALVIYKLIHGVNWFQVNSATAPATVAEVIRQSPGGFASAYFAGLLPLLPLLVGPLLLALAASDRTRKRFGWVSLFVVTPYILVVAAGGSSRGDLPVLWLVVVAWTALAFDLWSSRRVSSPATIAAVSVGIAAVLALWWVRADHGIAKSRARANASYRQVEQVLRADGVSSARQVFASDFSLYFPDLPGFTPRTNGSWLRVGNEAYRTRFPELCIESADCMIRDAKQAGITHLVLTPAARDLSPAAGRLYDSPDPALVDGRGGDDTFKVFRIR